jgi:FG-GAP repeat protein
VSIARFAFFGLVSLALNTAAFGQQPGHTPPNASTPWVQLAKLSTLNPYAPRIGGSIAISGNVVVVGGEYNQEALVYVMPAGGWQNMLPTASLKASDELACGAFGYSVSISGNTIVVGDPETYCFHGASGAAYVFVEPPGGWSGTIMQTATLTASDGSTGDSVGNSVSLGSDGNTIVTGAPLQSNQLGAAYVFTKPAGGWTNTTQTAKLTPSDGQANEDFGLAVAASSSVVAVGSPYETVGANQGQGAAYMYVEPPGGWSNATQTAKLTASDGQAYDYLGSAVSLSGQVLAAGAFDQGPGAVYVFVENSGGWVNATQTAKLTAAGGNPGDQLGASVVVSNNFIVAGAPWFSHSANDLTSPFFHEGMDYIFAKPATGWASETQSAMVTGSDARLGAYLGSSVAISGNTVVSGALFNNYNVGAAYVFTPYVPQ